MAKTGEEVGALPSFLLSKIFYLSSRDLCVWKMRASEGVALAACCALAAVLRLVPIIRAGEPFLQDGEPYLNMRLATSLIENRDLDGGLQELAWYPSGQNLGDAPRSLLAQLVVLLLQLVAAPLRANLSRTRAAGQRGVKEWSAPRCQKERSTDVNRREFSCGVDGVGQGAEEVA